MNQSLYVVEPDEANFSDVVLEASHRLPILVDFWAAWCAPCQMLAPTLAKLADEYAGRFLLAKVNADEQRGIAAEYAIRSLPTCKLFRDGNVVDEFLGAQPESVIRELLDRHLERESDVVRARAMEARAAGRLSEAARLLEQAMASDPQNHRTHLDLAQCRIEQRRFNDAEDVLKSLPSQQQMEPEVIKLLAALKFAKVADAATDASLLEQRVSDNPGDCEARYQLGAAMAVEGDYEGAMEQLLEIVRRDRSFKNDAGRKGLIDLFEIVGNSPLVNRYRALMSSALH